MGVSLKEWEREGEGVAVATTLLQRRRMSRADAVAPRSLPTHLLSVETLEGSEREARGAIEERQRRAASRRATPHAAGGGPATPFPGTLPRAQGQAPPLRAPAALATPLGVAIDDGEVRWNAALLNALSASPEAGAARSVLRLVPLRAGDDMAHLEAQQMLGRLLAAEWTRAAGDDRERYASVATFRCAGRHPRPRPSPTVGEGGRGGGAANPAARAAARQHACSRRVRGWRRPRCPSPTPTSRRSH